MDGELYFDIISTPNELLMQKGKKTNLNELNLVLKMNYRQFTALFPGDCGEAQTNDIIRSDQIDKVKNVFLLKAAHHGGDDSTTPEFITMCNAQAVIVTNDYFVTEHRPSFIGNMHNFSLNGAKVFRGDYYHDIEMTTNGRIVHCKGTTEHFEENVTFNTLLANRS